MCGKRERGHRRRQGDTNGLTESRKSVAGGGPISYERRIKQTAIKGMSVRVEARIKRRQERQRIVKSPAALGPACLATHPGLVSTCISFAMKRRIIRFRFLRCWRKKSVFVFVVVVVVVVVAVFYGAGGGSVRGVPRGRATVLTRSITHIHPQTHSSHCPSGAGRHYWAADSLLASSTMASTSSKLH